MSDRVTYRDTGREFSVFMAPRVNMLQLLIILASLTPFLFFLFRFVQNMRDAMKGGAGSVLPLLGGLLVWGLSGIFWLYSILMNAFGREIITVSGETLSIKKSFLGRGPVRKYRIVDISHMRIHGLRAPGSSFIGQFVQPGVSIVFTCGGKVHRLGSQLAEREARFMLDRLQTKLPTSCFSEKKTGTHPI